MKEYICVASIGLGSFLLGLASGMVLSDKKSCNECVYRQVVSDDVETVDISEMTKEVFADFERDTYDKYVAEYRMTEENEGRPEDISKESGDCKDDLGPIYPISFNDFGEFEDEGWVTDTLVYFEEDGVVCDMMDDSIRDYADYVGPNALEWFGELNDDEDLVYIRNHDRKMDFEFVRDHSSYKKTVLGLTPDAEELSDAAVQNALDYFGATTVEEIDPNELAKHHLEREDE